MGFDFTTLIFPGVLLSVFCIKYLVKKLYRLHFEKREAQRVANLNRLLISNPLLQTFNADPMGRIENVQVRAPPPNYEIALAQYPSPTAASVFYIQISEDAPPPTYDDYLKMNEESPPDYSLTHTVIGIENSKKCSVS